MAISAWNPQLISLACIAIISNAGYSTIAPILPLELERHLSSTSSTSASSSTSSSSSPRSLPQSSTQALPVVASNPSNSSALLKASASQHPAFQDPRERAHDHLDFKDNDDGGVDNDFKYDDAKYDDDVNNDDDVRKDDDDDDDDDVSNVMRSRYFGDLGGAGDRSHAPGAPRRHLTEQIQPQNSLQQRIEQQIQDEPQRRRQQQQEQQQQQQQKQQQQQQQKQPTTSETQEQEQEWRIAFIFLSFPVGFSACSPLVASRLETTAPIRMISWGMALCAVAFFCLGRIFEWASHYHFQHNSHDHVQNHDVSSHFQGLSDRLATDAEDGISNALLLALAMLQFLIGAFMSMIDTGYYSLGTSIFASDKESAMSVIESAVGVGFIIGPIVGSTIYDDWGYKRAYDCVAIVMVLMAVLTWRVFGRILSVNEKQPTRTPHYGDELAHCETAPGQLEQPGEDIELMECANLSKPSSHYRTSKISSNNTDGNVKHNNPYSNGNSNNFNSNYNNNLSNGNFARTAPQERNENKTPTSTATTYHLLTNPKIFLSSCNILWVNFSWNFLEPILAYRLENYFHCSAKSIGLIFASSNIIYVPAAYLTQYLPREYDRHTIIATSLALTPLAVMLVGSSLSFGWVVFGIVMLGLFPTPVWIMLLPRLQEDAFVILINEVQHCENRKNKFGGGGSAAGTNMGDGTHGNNGDKKPNYYNGKSNYNSDSYNTNHDRGDGHDGDNDETQLRQKANDIAAGIYNSFMTLGQIVGYIVGPTLNGYVGFGTTTKIAATMIMIHGCVYYFWSGRGDAKLLFKGR